jgi:actin-related protein
VIPAGGTTSLTHFNKRLQMEVAAKMPPVFKLRLQAPSYVERPCAAWIGGSILSSLGTFHQLWMTRQEYLEHGTQLVERKCH